MTVFRPEIGACACPSNGWAGCGSPECRCRRPAGPGWSAPGFAVSRFAGPRYLGSAQAAQEQLRASSTGADVAKASASAVTAGGTAALTLITAAGGVSALGPPGWIAAGGLAIAAGVVGLVNGIKNGSVRKAAAVKMAQKLGIKDADEVPAFAAKALKWSQSKRKKRLAKIKRKLKRKRGRRRQGRARTRRIDKLRTQRQVLEAVMFAWEVNKRAAQRKHDPKRKAAARKRRQAARLSVARRPSTSPAVVPATSGFQLGPGHIVAAAVLASLIGLGLAQTGKRKGKSP